MAFCAHCGRPLDASASFCTSCGAATSSAPAMEPAALAGAPAPAHADAHAPAHAPAPVRTRPVGVTIVGVVMLIGGAFAAMGAAALLLFGFFAGSLGAAFDASDWFPFGSLVGGAILFAMMVAALFVGAFAALGIATGVGVLKGRSWAWALTFVVMGLVGLSALGDLAQQDLGGILGLAAAGLVIWYFLQPDVKRWFSKA